MAAQRLLTDSDVKKLPAPPHGNRITYDKEGTGQATTKQTPVAGFGIRVTAAGARSFIIRYRTLAGKERRYTIGDASTWNVAVAREAAKEILRKLPDGVDPLGEREAARKAEAGAKSVAAMCELFVEDHLPDLREKTRDDYKLMIDREILPALGKFKVAEVSFDDVRALHKKIGRGDGKGRARPYLANRVAALLSCMFTKYR
jgi:Arm domain-containing DNA-binding protein/integrase-like protein